VTDPAARTSFVRTAVAGVAGAALAAVSAGQTWATATVSSPATRSAVAKGTEVAPLALPLCLVALAAWGSVLVLRRTGRRVVALLGLAAAAGAVVVVVASLGRRAEAARDVLGADQARVSTTAWPYVALVAAVVTTVAFAVAVRRAASWPEMSRRYDAPDGAAHGGSEGPAAGSPAEPSDRDLWRALDEGRDPTA
jgi:uncharacterized membrane protein (TIGR02234 family)